MNIKNIKTSNVVIKDLTPKVKNIERVKYLPDTLFVKSMSFDLGDVSTAVANGIRRTVANEILTTAMYFEIEDFRTDNPFCMNSMILNRLRSIPIDQKCPPNTTFELHAVNTTDQTISVYSEQVKVHGNRKLPFNKNIVLFTLEPGKSLEIKKITLIKSYGYIFAGHALTSNAVCLALDQEPLNTFTEVGSKEPFIPTGIPSRMSNPRQHRIQFITTGAMDPIDIVAAACDSIVERCGIVLNSLYTISTEGNINMLTIEGESDTIGNLIMRTLLELYPEGITITYTNDAIVRRVTIKVICNEDVNDVLTDVINHIINIYKAIKKEIQK